MLNQARLWWCMLLIEWQMRQVLKSWRNTLRRQHATLTEDGVKLPPFDYLSDRTILDNLLRSPFPAGSVPGELQTQYFHLQTIAADLRRQSK